jgi:hypothetical protein
MGEGFSWVSIVDPNQPELEVTLGGLGLWVDDCRKTHHVLVEKGVTFLQERADRPYGWRPSCATTPAVGWCWSNRRNTQRPASTERPDHAPPSLATVSSTTTSSTATSECRAGGTNSRSPWRASQ